MAVFGGMILTNKGLVLQGKAQAGAQLNYTRIAVGDGSLTGQSIPALNGLISQKKSLAVTRLKTLPPNKVTVGTVLRNADVTTGFYWREVGLFAQDPDAGEILYAYANAGVTADYIPPGGGSDIIEKQFDVVVVVGTAANISATIDQSLVFAKKSELDAVDAAKVDKVSGKGLSTNDYTTTEKTKLAGIATGAGGAGTATDTVIGNRTIADTTAPTGDTGTLTTLLGWLGNMIKSITGKSSWRTAPATTLEAAAAHNNDNVRHITAAERTTWNGKLDSSSIGNTNGAVPVNNGTLNTNLNADMVDSYHALTASAANTLVVQDASQAINVGATFTRRGSSSGGQVHQGLYSSADAAGLRWGVGMAGAETGKGNVGADYSIWAYDDAGAGLGQAMKITRAGLGVSFSGAVTAPRFISSQAQGTAPFQVTSSTLVTNLNADLLDGLQGANYMQTGTVVADADMNTVNTAGVYRMQAGLMSNLPGSGYYYGQTLVLHAPGTDTAAQLIFPYIKASGPMYRRGNPAEVGGAGTYSPWFKIWTEENMGAGGGLDADMLDGMQTDAWSNGNTIPYRDSSGNLTTSRFISTAGQGTAPFTVTSSTVVTNLNADLLDGYHVDASSAAVNTIPIRDGNGFINARGLYSTVATGTAPVQVTSTTLNPNLNADMVDGYHASTTNNASTIVARDANGIINVSRMNISVATGQSPLVVNSSTQVANLNAHYLNGYQSSTAATGSTMALRDSNGAINGTAFRYGNGGASTGILSYGPTGLITLEASSANTSINLKPTGTGSVYTEGLFYASALLAKDPSGSKNVSLEWENDYVARLFVGDPAGEGIDFKITGDEGDRMAFGSDGTATAKRYVSTQATGSSPLVVTSTTVVSNLNVDMLDGVHANASSVASTIPVRNSNKKIAEVAANRVVVRESLLGTTNTTVATHTAVTSALYSVKVSVRTSATPSVGVSITVNYTGPGGTKSEVLASSQYLSTGDYYFPIPLFNANAGSAINVVAAASQTNSAWVSAVITEEG